MDKETFLALQTILAYVDRFLNAPRNVVEATKRVDAWMDEVAKEIE